MHAPNDSLVFTTVKELLGHSSIQITEKYYIFVFPEDKSKTAELINDLISIKN